MALEVILGLVLRAATSIVANGAKAGDVGNESPIPDESTLDGVAVLKQGVCSLAGGLGESLIPSEYWVAPMISSQIFSSCTGVVDGLPTVEKNGAEGPSDV